MFPFDLFASPRERTRKRVRILYGDQAEAVMRELDRYAGSVTADRDRVHRAILELSEGSFENLKRWVEVALQDYRDVLGPAEYPDSARLPRFDASTPGNQTTPWSPRRALPGLRRRERPRTEQSLRGRSGYAA